jgi:hypothetical protein
MLALRVIHIAIDGVHYRFCFRLTVDEGIEFEFAVDSELPPDRVDAWLPRTIAELPI